MSSPSSVLVVEFTSARSGRRPLTARAGGISVGAGRLPLRCIDIDRHPELRRGFRITHVPTFVVLQGMRELARFVGPHSRRELGAAVAGALDPHALRLAPPPQPRGLWNDFTARLWAFSSA